MVNVIYAKVASRQPSIDASKPAALPIVAGNVGVDALNATFDAEWDGLTICANFAGRCPEETREVELTEGEDGYQTTIPDETIRHAGNLFVSFVGRTDGVEVLRSAESLRLEIAPSYPRDGVQPTPAVRDIVGRAIDATRDALAAAAEAVAAALRIRNLTVSAHDSQTATAEVSEGDTGFQIEFGLPKGEKGDKGDKGEKGDPGGDHPYLSLERLSSYLYSVTFGELAPYDGATPVAGACSSYVSDGKLHRNFDWHYDDNATFRVVTRDFEGISTIDGLTDDTLDDELIAQLPYCVVDGVNRHGIMVSTHVLYDDWDWHGAGDIPLTLLPYMVLTRAASMDALASDLTGIIGDLYAPDSFGGYLIQVLVTDGTTTKVLAPNEGGTYEILDATDTPKLANFRWVGYSEVERGASYMQTRPTGVERWNMMPCALADLRFTAAYEQPTRLSEFIGIDGTTKASTDAQLTAIYDRAHAAYLTRTRDGSLWQTMHSVVYGASGMEHLWVQEDWSKDYIASAGGTSDHSALDNLSYDSSGHIGFQRELTAGTGINIDGGIISISYTQVSNPAGGTTVTIGG